MNKRLTISDIQKLRFDSGTVVYNTSNYTFGIVLDGNRGEDSDPCSVVLEQCLGSFVVHTPPNRALIPAGRHIDLNELLPKLPNVGDSNG